MVLERSRPNLGESIAVRRDGFLLLEIDGLPVRAFIRCKRALQERRHEDAPYSFSHPTEDEDDTARDLITQSRPRPLEC